MDHGTISLFLAFAAGVLSFISPCILPLVPAYLTYITGVSLSRNEAPAHKATARTLLHASAFVTGFSLVFVALGASASLIGALFTERQDAIRIFGGVLLIVFGIHLTGLIKLSWLNMEKRAALRNRPGGYLGSFFVGLAFAAGWTPCIGPILGGILVYVAATETIARGTLLLTFYSLGLAIPFMISAAAIGWFFSAYDKVKPWLQWTEVVSGVLLVAVGLLLLVNGFGFIAARLTGWFPFLILN